MNKKPYIAPNMEVEPMERMGIIATTGDEPQKEETIDYEGDDNGNGIAESNRINLFDDTLD